MSEYQHNTLEKFLDGKRFAVVGASQDRSKYGNKVLRVYQQNRYDVVPVNPKADVVEGLKAYPDLASIPGTIHAVSIITPPAVTERVVQEAIQKGIKHIWMQPGAESPAAVALCREKGINIIADGSCLLVVLGYHEH